MTQLILAISLWGYVPLIQKDSSTHMHGLTVYVKEGLSFAGNLSLESFADSSLCFWPALLHSVSYFFYLYWSPPQSLCMVFDSISSNIDKALSINPSANLFDFRDLSIHHKDWLTHSGGTNRSGEFWWINFLSQTISLRWLTFLLRSQTEVLTVLLFWIYLFLLTLVFVLQWLSLHWEILIMLLSQFPLTFYQVHNEMSPFIA